MSSERGSNWQLNFSKSPIKPSAALPSCCSSRCGRLPSSFSSGSSGWLCSWAWGLQVRAVGMGSTMLESGTEAPAFWNHWPVFVGTRLPMQLKASGGSRDSVWGSVMGGCRKFFSLYCINMWKKKDPSEMLLLSQKNQFKFNRSAHRPMHCLAPEKTRLFHLGAAVHSLKIKGSVTKKRWKNRNHETVGSLNWGNIEQSRSSSFPRCSLSPGWIGRQWPRYLQESERLLKISWILSSVLGASLCSLL